MEESPDLWYSGEVDTPEHTFFRCNRWNAQRLQLQLEVILTPENLVEKMLDTAENWRAVIGMAREILGSKEEDARRRKRENNGR